MSHDQSRGYGGPPQGQYNPMGGHPAPYPGDNYHEVVIQSDKQKSNKGGMLAAGAGGLVLGGLAGHALADDSDDGECT